MRKEWEVPEHEIAEFKPRITKYCLCIPIINEGERFLNQLKRLAFIKNQLDILILDGGSTDGSTEPELLKQNGVRALLTKRGPGKLSAQLRMGYAYALEEGYEGIITVDGNGKDGVEALPLFIQALEEGMDFVQGSRFIKGGEAVNTPFVRHVAVKALHVPLISLAAGFRYTDTTNGFRAYSSTFLLDERVQPFRNIFETYELLAYLSVRAPQLGYRTSEVPVKRVYPRKGKVPTKISFFKGNSDLLKILLEVNTGKYNPVQTKHAKNY